MAIELAKAYVQIVPSADGISGKISQAINGEAEKAGKSAGSKLSSALGSVLGVGSKAILGATSAIGAFGVSAVGAGKDFDAAMSQVAATMEKSVEEIGDLREFAQEMGSTTAFSATEAAEALNYMALAGYDVKESMTMLPNVLNLAAAGGIGLAEASDMVTDASSALGLTFEKTTIMVDQMARASSKTNTSVAQLGEAILTIGGTAKNLSGGTVELATVLGVLADNDIKASEAGTHLRNIMLAMNPTTDAATAAWRRLGVEAYDNEGNLRDLGTVMTELNDAMSDMTQQEKTKILSEMFNKTDLAAVDALLSTSTEKYDKLKKEITESDNAAERMKDIQLDNLAGDMTFFQSALEGAKIAVSDKLTPTIREFVEFGTDGLSRLTSAFKTNGLSGAMNEFGVLLSEGLTKAVDMLPEIVNAGANLINALIRGIGDNISKVMEAANAILMTIVTTIIDNLPEILKIAIQIIGELVKGFAEAAPDLIPAIVDCVFVMADTLIDNIDLMIDASIELVMGLTEGIVKALPKLIEKVPEIVVKIAETIIRTLPKIGAAGKEIIMSLADGFASNWPALKEAVSNLAKQIPDIFKRLVSEIKEVGKNIAEGLLNGIKTGWNAVVDDVKGLGNKLLDGVKGVFGIHSPSREFAWIGEMCTAGLAKGMEDIPDVVSDTQKALDSTFKVASSMNVMYRAAEPVRTDTAADIAGAVYDALNNLTIKAEMNPNMARFFDSMRAEAEIYHNRTGREARYV